MLFFKNPWDTDKALFREKWTLNAYQIALQLRWLVINEINIQLKMMENEK